MVELIIESAVRPAAGITHFGSELRLSRSWKSEIKLGDVHFLWQNILLVQNLVVILCKDKEIFWICRQYIAIKFAKYLGYNSRLMYNGKKIKELLDERGQNNAALLSALGLDPKKNSLKTVINGNPTANRLEQVADFFGVPIDTLFIREGMTDPLPTSIELSSIEALKQEVAKREEFLRLKDEIIREKEERIKLLEALNSVYIKQLSGN